ncbi:hypothetical protein L249_3341, partial [Ophiocordyceps polyrhachis-furcata BCC 54312]
MIAWRWYHGKNRTSISQVFCVRGLPRYPVVFYVNSTLLPA